MSLTLALAHRPWVAILMAGVAPTAATLFYTHAPSSSEQMQVFYFATKVLIFAFPITWWLLVENQPQLEPGRQVTAGTRRPLRADLALGLGTGCLIGLSILAAYWLVLRGMIDAGELAEQSRRFGADRHFLWLAGFLAIVNSGLEEYYWRWFVFGRLRRLVRPAGAMVLSALAFASHHFFVLAGLLGRTDLAAILTFGVAAGGAIWAGQYHYAGRLWGAWLSHFLVDATILGIGYYILFPLSQSA